MAADIQEKGGLTTAVVTTQNVDRLDVLLDGRPRRSIDVTDGSITINLSESVQNVQHLRLDGYHGGKPVASTRAELSTCATGGRGAPSVRSLNIGDGCRTRRCAGPSPLIRFPLLTRRIGSRLRSRPSW